MPHRESGAFIYCDRSRLVSSAVAIIAVAIITSAVVTIISSVTIVAIKMFVVTTTSVFVTIAIESLTLPATTTAVHYNHSLRTIYRVGGFINNGRCRIYRNTDTDVGMHPNLGFRFCGNERTSEDNGSNE
jgi:hypothetical protein